MSDVMPLSVPGSGGPSKVTADDLAMLVDEVDRIRGNAASALVERARDAAAARYCVWSGQSSDGRKHGPPDKDGNVFPYKGASDARIRLVDFLVTFRTAICLAAAADGSRAVAPMEVTDAAFSGRMQTLLSWVLENQLGETLHAELSRLVSYVEGDSPGAAVMGVYWRRDTGTDVLSVTLEDLVARLVQDASPDSPVDASFLTTAFQDKASEPLATFALLNIFPGLDRKAARQAVKDLRETGTATFPVPVTRYDGVVLCAHRLWDDIFIPVNCERSIQRAPAIFIREMLTEVELRERVTTDGYAKDFVETLLGTRDGNNKRIGGYVGDSMLDEAYREGQQTLSSDGLRLYPGDDLPWHGKVEIVTAYYRAITDTGHAGIFCVPFSPLAKLAAKPRDLCGYAHGKYPFVYFAAEYHNNHLLFSRSTAERATQDQTAVKKLHDAAVCHAEITALPPLEADDKIGAVQMGPLAVNKTRRGQQAIRGIDLPARATGALDMLGAIDRRVAMYNGIPHPEVPEEVTLVMQRHLVSNFLASYREVLVMILQLCQQYMTPEQLSAVTGAKPDQSAIPSPEAIRARFNLRVTFDPRVLNGEYLGRLMDLATKLVSLDSKGVVMRDRLVAIIARSLDPALADYALQPVEQADQQEVEQTKADFAKIMAGVMPNMPEQGVNYATRLDTLKQIISANPLLRAPGRVPPDAEAALQQYTDWLEQGIAQEENKVIGRLGTSPDLDVEEAMRIAQDRAEPGPAPVDAGMMEVAP